MRHSRRRRRSLLPPRSRSPRKSNVASSDEMRLIRFAFHCLPPATLESSHVTYRETSVPAKRLDRRKEGVNPLVINLARSTSTDIFGGRRRARRACVRACASPHSSRVYLHAFFATQHDAGGRRRSSITRPKSPTRRRPSPFPRPHHHHRHRHRPRPPPAL